MSKAYQQKTDRMNRSFDYVEQAGQGNPWKLLASAIIFQAAADCQNYDPIVEDPISAYRSGNGLRYCRKTYLLQFINSDWIDTLISWQNEVKPEAVREELVRRLQHDYN